MIPVFFFPSQTDSMSQSHPHARKFRNQPFPEWYDLQIIFGTAATGEGAMSLSQRLSRDPPERPIEDPASSDDDEPRARDPSQGRPRKRQRHSTGAALTSAVEKLVDVFAKTASSSSTQTTNKASQSSVASQNNTIAGKTDNEAVDEAVSIFQDTMAATLPEQELIVGFSVLANPSKARVYLRVDDMYKLQWLRFEIQKQLNTN